MKIIIVDPNDSWRNLLFRGLIEEGHEVRRSPYKSEAWGIIQETNPHVVITEYRFKDGTGVELAEMIRSSFPATSVIFVSRATDIASVVAAYQSGADVYIKKPTSVDEIAAAVLSVGRKIKPERDLAYDYLRVDKATGIVKADDAVVEIGSSRDLQLLVYFLRNPDRVVSEIDLYQAVWGFSKLVDAAQINRAVRRVNSQLKKHGRVMIYPAALDGHILTRVQPGGRNAGIK